MDIKINKSNRGVPSTKFTPDRIDSILKDINNGIPYEIAAINNGIADRTFYEWVEQGKLDLYHEIESDHAKLAQALYKIKTFHIKNHLLSITSSEKGHKGSEWYLERAYWKNFSSKVAEIEFNERISKLERKQNGKEMDSSNEDEEGSST